MVKMANNLIKIVLILIFVLSHVKGKDFLKFSLSKDYNKYEPPVSAKENEQDFDPLEVQFKFKSVMIIEIDEEHQAIIADIEINSYWVENRLVVTGNKSGLHHKVMNIF